MNALTGRHAAYRKGYLTLLLRTYLPCKLSGTTEKKVYVVLIDQKAECWWWWMHGERIKLFHFGFTVLFISVMIDHTTEKKNDENK